MKKDYFSADLVQKIKDSTNIVEVVGEHVVLRKTGGNHVGLCPFHSERTPSFNVNENRQFFFCHGCKKGGDLIHFVMEILGLSFLEAIEELADRARVALPQDWSSSVSPEQTEEQRKKREHLALAYKLNRFVAAFFHHQMKSSGEATHYLKRRGVNEEWQKAFYVGAASDAWHHLANHLEKQKAPLSLAVELGLIRPSQRTGMGSRAGTLDSPYFDLFRHRVMFPIVNLGGKVAGFGGRVLGAEESPKYLNSPESVVFQKSKLAYGLFQAQKHIREKDEVILVEGYFDVLALHAAGFRNAVATCGTSLTPDHLAVFKRLAKKIIVLFDGDSAGRKATERAMEIGLEQGWVLHAGELPNGKDPDEILFDSETGALNAAGVEQMSALLKQSLPILDLKMNESLARGMRSREEQSQEIKQMAGWLAKLSDPVGREVRIQYASERLRVPQDLIHEAIRQRNAERVSVSHHTSGGGSGVSRGGMSSVVSPRGSSGDLSHSSGGITRGGLRSASPGWNETKSSGSFERGGQRWKEGERSSSPSRYQNSGFSSQRSQFMEDRSSSSSSLMGRGGFSSSKGRMRAGRFSDESLSAGRTSDASLSLGRLDRVLLQGVLWGGEFLKVLQEMSSEFPSEINFKDLLEYPPAQKWVEEFLKKAALPGSGGRAAGLETLEGVDSQVREVISEVWVASEPLFEAEEFRGALKKRLALQWARFSQRLGHQISQAELRNDAELQTKLMKEYLDVQRKMKDFNSFYDEA